MSKRSVLKVYKALEQSEGAGARVKRTIGVSDNKNFNPFMGFDHFKVSPKAGFPKHPHRGQETITYLIKGCMAHEDFTGSKGILLPGDLQFMTAGKGIVHSEMPVNLDGDQNTVVEGLQLWVDLPEKLRFTKPRYRDLREYEIPEVVEQDGKVRVKVISGEFAGVESVRDLAYTPMHFYYVTLEQGGVYTQKVSNDYNYFLYVIKGKHGVINGNVPAPEFHNIFFNRDGEEIEVKNEGEDTVEFILVGGLVLDQKTVQGGPFVLGSDEEINQAFEDFYSASNGFEKLRTWKSKISNGVTLDMIDELGGNMEKRNEEKRKYLELKKQAS